MKTKITKICRVCVALLPLSPLRMEPQAHGNDQEEKDIRNSATSRTQNEIMTIKLK